MKRAELVFNLFSVPLDAVMLLFAGVSAFYLRFRYESFIGPIIFELNFANFLLLCLKVLPAVLFFFAWFGLYKITGARRLAREFSQISLAIITALSLVVILFFFDRTIFPSRFIILSTGALAVFYVFMGRVSLMFVQRLLFKKNYGLHRIALILGGSDSLALVKTFQNRTAGYELVATGEISTEFLEKLRALAVNRQIDEIIQTNPDLSSQFNTELLWLARQHGMQFSFVPNSFEMQRNVIEINALKGTPIITIKNTPLDGWGKVIKRLIDLVLSILAMLVLLPVFILIYIMIKLDSPGPVIYAALRGGKDKDFWFYKFRSMYAHLSPGLGGEEAEKLRKELWQKNDRGGESGPFLKIKNDPRVTRVGRILRKTKLDEIPQFWNVLKGDMSLVGPRAHVLDEVAKYRSQHSRLFSIKPGIFGLSQIAQSSNPNLPFEEEIRLNTFYIEHWSVWMDIKILFTSIYLLIFGRNSREDY